MSDSWEWAQMAALAAEQALRPAARSRGARSFGKQPLREPIFAAMTAGQGGYPSTWMASHGQGVRDALMDLTGVDEPMASWFTAAALYALQTCQQDLTVHAVLTLAERAVTWHQGAEYGAHAAAAAV